MSIETSFDQAGYTKDRLLSVGKNLLMGIALVLMVLLVTLGWRAALVVAVILPLCTLMSMIALFYLKIPIQHMSVTGLVVALGLLVDGSIVMTDEIRKRLFAGLPPTEAMRGAVTRMRIPLMSSTLTTVLAFIPTGPAARRRGRLPGFDRRGGGGDAGVVLYAGGDRDAGSRLSMVALRASRSSVAGGARAPITKN